MAIVDGWLSWAIKAPGPPEKFRYPNDPERAMSEILYIVLHSAEGWEPFLKQGHRPGEDASWTFSNMLDGDFYQHAPLSGLSWTSGGYIQNRDGLACEQEGKGTTPFNALQVANVRRMREDVAKVCPNLRAPLLGSGFREHSELTNGATQCPSGRAAPVYASYLQAEEEDMLNEDDKEWIRKAVAFQISKALDDEHTEFAALMDAAVAPMLAKLNSMPQMILSDGDLKALAKYVNDDAAERMKE